MKSMSLIGFGLVASVILVGSYSSGLAQPLQGTSDGVSEPTTELLHKNVQELPWAARSPGKMVQNRVAQLQNVTDPPPASITATEEPGPFDLFMAGLVDVFFSALQNILTAFADLFLERMGLTPDDSNTNGNDNSNANDNSNTNVNTNTNDNENTNENTNDNSNENSNANVNENDNSTRPGGVRKKGR